MTIAKPHLELRRELGASDGPRLMWSDESRMQLYREKVGLDPPPDFTRNWDVQRGNREEEPSLDWHEVTLGYKLIERNVVCYSDKYPYLSATPDAIDPVRNAVVEFKSTRGPVEWLERYYAPQLEIQKHCRKLDRAIMLISQYGGEPFEIDIDPGEEYRRKLFEMIPSFMWCVNSLTPPSPVGQIVPPDKLRTIDLREPGDENYRDEMSERLQGWLETKDHHDDHEELIDAIKKLVPDDVGKVFFYGVVIKRNRKGTLIIARTP